MEVETSGMCADKTIAIATIRCIVTVAIVVYKGLRPVVCRMLTSQK